MICNLWSTSVIHLLRQHIVCVFVRSLFIILDLVVPDLLILFFGVSTGFICTSSFTEDRINDYALQIIHALNRCPEMPKQERCRHRMNGCGTTHIPLQIPEILQAVQQRRSRYGYFLLGTDESMYKGFSVDIDGFVTKYLKLPIIYQKFAEDDMSKLGFISDGKTPLSIFLSEKKIKKYFPKVQL